MMQTNSWLYFRKPSADAVKHFISSQRDAQFSYFEVGATRTGGPPGYTVDHNRVKLGAGEETYQKAVGALRRWKHFDLGWVKIVPENLPIEIGTTVAVQARTLGIWSLNACRLVYLLGDGDDFKGRFGFAYGTLPNHAERGEERFTIEWHSDDSVWYDLYAFSRPQRPLVRLGYAYARKLQKRFARQSLAAMAGGCR